MEKLYITYRGIEGKILSDCSIICIHTGTKRIFKSIKSFKRFVSQFVYKYIDCNLTDKTLKKCSYSSLLTSYINEFDCNY